MAKYNLIIQNIDYYKEKGVSILTPSFRKYHEPTLGNGIAHDIIDHPIVPHPDGYIDELMAIGSRIARIENYEPGSLEDDLFDLDHQIPSSFMKNSPYLLKIRADNKQIDSIVNNTITKGSKKIVKSWINEGYNRFNHRFLNCNKHDITEILFNKITDIVNKWLYWGDVGMKAELVLHFPTNHVELIMDGYFSVT